MKRSILMFDPMHALLRDRNCNLVFCRSVVAPRNACVILLRIATVVTCFHNITV